MRILVIPTLLLCGVSDLSAQQPDPGPPPGWLIDVGGRRLHLLCGGAGSPTIVLEAGASSFAIDWTLVQQELATSNRVCSYDRAGSGWSDPPARGSSVPVSLDLHNLLRAAGEPAPYVMVGASLGGIYVRHYQADYPEEVVGLVLVDPASEDRLFTMFNGQVVEIASLTAEQVRSTLPTAPVAVPKRRPQQGAPFDRLPEALYQIRLKLDQRLIASVPDTVSPEAIARFREIERANLARLRELRLKTERPLAGLPLVVLTRGTDQGDGLVESHQRLAALSSNSRHVVATGAGHEIHLFAPELVVRAIRDVVQAGRTDGKLPE